MYHNVYSGQPLHKLFYVRLYEPINVSAVLLVFLFINVYHCYFCLAGKPLRV